MPLYRILLIISFSLCTLSGSYAFQQPRITGTVADSAGHPVEKAGVSFAGISAGSYTDPNGFFSLLIPEGTDELTVVFSHVGYRTETRTVRNTGNNIILDVILHRETKQIEEITVTAKVTPPGFAIMQIPVKDLELLPSASGSFEAILKTMPGVTSNNELSSQYSVRGGNYDENLVYVNDNEIYRPFLIRSGQQEGLSFVNSDLVSSVHFSPGGFGASYGDKMSSVLDVRYRKPVSRKGSLSLGLLTSSFHLEGITLDSKLTWLIGLRYKSSNLMLKTLDSKGDYQPVFADVQSLLTYRTGRNSVLNLLLTFSSNTYNFIPQSRVSSFGTEISAYQLFVLFNGREKDKYNTWNGAVSWDYSGPGKFNHKIMVSSFVTAESESFDIRGNYSLNSLDKVYGSENFSDTLMNIGIGSWISHARNKLYANIQAINYKGEKLFPETELKWGIGFKNFIIDDRIREWSMVDSAGFSVPYNDQGLYTETIIRSENTLTNKNFSTYFESFFPVRLGTLKVLINPGLRVLLNTFTDELLFSPRLSAKVELTSGLSGWLASGYYFQPPFYREMRLPDGSVNQRIRSQRSIHTLIGIAYEFTADERPFRISAEIYNKNLGSIIPYMTDNVRLIYSGVNEAIGYSRGIDVRLNGEFVPGSESWLSVSLMDSRLNIPIAAYGSFPSPADQTLSVDLFFQDYLPSQPSLRAHLNLAFTTGIPVISPFSDRYDLYHRLPAYRRIDLGLTKVFKNAVYREDDSHKQGIFNEIIIGFEIFNLLDINNTVSYLWVRTVNNYSGISRQYAIPNYLTGRSLNLKISASF